MGLDAMKTRVHILKGLSFSIKTCYRLVRNHPSILGIMLIFYLLYRFLPSVFKFLLHSSPVFICTSILLATLVTWGHQDPPKVEDKLQRRYSRRLRVKKDDHVIEEKEITSVRTIGRKMIDIKEEIETTSTDAQRNKRKARGRRVTFSPVHDYGFISRTIQMDDDQPNEIHDDVSIADNNQDVVKEEISMPVDEISDSRASIATIAPIATTNPVIDELPPVVPVPVPDLQTPQPVLISINEFDGAPEESNDCSEESEAEQGKDKSKVAVSWTENDEKNLMDLGCSEVERNKRLESLMARRRARKTMRRETDHKNHLGGNDFDSNDVPYRIAPLSIIKNKTFAQPFIENETGGMQQIPGSAPSVLIPRKNPFDLPYDPHEEKPNLTGDSFSQEFMTVLQKDVYCRHESFCFGSASLSGGLKQGDKGDTRISAFFIPEDISSSSRQRQLSDTSTDSVSSSVPETELVQSSIVEQEEEQKQVIEQEGEMISNIEQEHQEHAGDVEINLPNTSEAYINPDVVEEKLSELNSCSSSSSSPSSEMSEKFLHEENTKGLCMADDNSNLKNDIAGVDYSIPSAIDESLFCVDKGVVHTSFPSLTSFPSIASDMQVEVSEVGSPPLSVERTISLTDVECFQYNEGVKSDISSGSEVHWTASSGLCAVDETESKSREVNEICESDVIKAGLLGVDGESDEPVVIEPGFEQVQIDSNSTSYPTECQINQISTTSAEPETNVGVCESDSKEKVDPIASSSSPVQPLVEKSTCQKSLNGDVGEVTQTTSMVQHSSNSIIDEVTQISSEFHRSPSGDLHGERPISSMVQESLNGDVHELKQVNTTVQPSPSGDIHEEAQVNSIVHPSPNDIHEETQVNSIMFPSPDGDLHEETHVNEMVQPSFNGDLHEETQAKSMVQPSLNGDIHEVTNDSEMVQPSPNGDIHEETHASSMVQPSPNGDIHEVINGSEMVQPSLNGDLHEETHASSMVQPTTNGDRQEVTQVNTMVQPSPNGDIHEETQVRSIMHPSPDCDPHEETHGIEMVQPSLNDDLHEETQASSMVQPSPNVDIHKETHVSEMVQPSLNDDLHEETQASSMVQPSPNGDIHEETQVRSIMYPSPDCDLHEETHDSEMVQPSLNYGDLHEETHASSMVQPSPKGDLHEETHASSMVQPSPKGDLHEETHASLMVQPSPNVDIHKETHVSEMVQPSLNDDLHEEIQTTSMVQPTPNGDIQEETHASKMVQPSLSGDPHEETQASEMVQPTTNGDPHEVIQVNTMVKGDLHEETQASSMVQPTTDGDRHEVTQEPSSIMSTDETGKPILVSHNTEKPKSSIEDVAHNISDKSTQDNVTINLPQTKATEGDANNVNKPVIVNDEDKPKPLSIEEVSDKSVEHGTTMNSPQELLSKSGVSSDDRRLTGIQKQDSEADDHVDNETSSNINRSSTNSPQDVLPEQEVLQIPMESQEESSPAKSPPQQQYLTEHEGLRSLLS